VTDAQFVTIHTQQPARTHWTELDEFSTLQWEKRTARTPIIGFASIVCIGGEKINKIDFGFHCERTQSQYLITLLINFCILKNTTMASLFSNKFRRIAQKVMIIGRISSDFSFDMDDHILT
jgi:hypothetical protein